MCMHVRWDHVNACALGIMCMCVGHRVHACALGDHVHACELGSCECMCVKHHVNACALALNTIVYIRYILST